MSFECVVTPNYDLDVCMYAQVSLKTKPSKLSSSLLICGVFKAFNIVCWLIFFPKLYAYAELRVINFSIQSDK